MHPSVHACIIACPYVCTYAPRGRRGKERGRPRQQREQQGGGDERRAHHGWAGLGLVFGVALGCGLGWTGCVGGASFGDVEARAGFDVGLPFAPSSRPVWRAGSTVPATELDRIIKGKTLNHKGCGMPVSNQGPRYAGLDILTLRNRCTDAYVSSSPDTPILLWAGRRTDRGLCAYFHIQMGNLD